MGANLKTGCKLFVFFNEEHPGNYFCVRSTTGLEGMWYQFWQLTQKGEDGADNSAGG